MRIFGGRESECLQIAMRYVWFFRTLEDDEKAVVASNFGVSIAVDKEMENSTILYRPMQRC